MNAITHLEAGTEAWGQVSIALLPLKTIWVVSSLAHACLLEQFIYSYKWIIYIIHSFSNFCPNQATLYLLRICINGSRIPSTNICCNKVNKWIMRMGTRIGFHWRFKDAHRYLFIICYVFKAFLENYWWNTISNY